MGISMGISNAQGRHAPVGLGAAALVLSCGILLSGCQNGIDLGDASAQFVSEQEVQTLSLQTWQRIKQDTPVSKDRQAQRRVERIAGRIVDASGLGSQNWEVLVFDSDEINAFALPGGRIGVYRGLIELVENDAQLAAVIAHEVAHVTNDHSRERVGASKATQTGLQAVKGALEGGNVAYANQVAALLGVGAQYGVILPYGRTQELEADRQGLIAMAKAGFDPREAVALWRRMGASKSGAPPEFLSTHPSNERRIEQLQKLMPEALSHYRKAS